VLRRRIADRRGQAIILIAAAMPIFLAMGGFVIEGGHMFVAKRHLQNVADAAALAAARDLPLDGSACSGACIAQVKHDVTEYAGYNNFFLSPPKFFHPCDPADSTDTNCFDTPHNGSTDLIQVRVTLTLAPIFANALGMGPFKISAKATASAAAQTTVSGTPDYTGPDSTSTGVIPGSTTVVTDPPTTTVITTPDGTTTVVTPGGTTTIVTPPTTTYSTSTGTETSPGVGDGGLAFAMSTDCPAITYNGAGGDSIGSLETNGGVAIQSNGLQVDYLAWGKRKTSGCDPQKGTIDQSVGPFSPQPWPLTPPNPAPPAGCRDTGPGPINAGWMTTHAPGVYCSSVDLSFSANGTNFTGYTWFAPSITVSSKDQTFKPASGQTTIFDAYSGNLTLQGQNNTVSGNMFAPNGQAKISGGGLGAGKGFVEAQTLSITGNFANYTGTGGFGGIVVNTVTVTTPITIPGSTTVQTLPDSTTTVTIPGTTSTVITPGGTTTTTTPDSTTTITIPGLTITGSTTTITTGTTIGMNE
jgi:hypothetical protein